MDGRATLRRQVRLLTIPEGRLGLEHFAIESAPLPRPGPGELLLKVILISLDAANRAWMQGATYRGALAAGSVMAGGGLAEVVETGGVDGFAPGDLVTGDLGWQTHAVLPAASVRKLARRDPITHLMSVYGIAGLTAYFGLLSVGDPAPGETVVVSAAAGSVGVFVGQIARIKGCRVVGIAGGREKCAWLRDALGFDEAVDYKAEDFGAAFKRALPDGIDVCFDNVGGEILERCLFRMNQGGRVVCCGAVSQYDGAPPGHGPRGVPGLIVTRRLRMQGFIVYDFREYFDAALADLGAWVAQGRLKVPEDVIEGFDNLPGALIGLLAGENRGKRMVRVAEPSDSRRG